MKALLTLCLVLASSSSSPSMAFQGRTTGPVTRRHRHRQAPRRLSGRFVGRSAAVNDDPLEQHSSSAKNGGTATIPDEIFNLVKGIVGAGVLALPAGIAAFSNQQRSAVYPAVALIALIGALSGYGFALIGRTCALTGAKSFREAWSASISPKSSWICAWTVTLKTMCAVLAYSMILADTFQTLALTAGLKIGKTTVLGAMTTCFLLPLCLLKDLSSLAPFSLLGSLGMVYTAMAMTIRLVSKAYVPGVGMFAKDLAPQLVPAFGGSSSSVGAAALLLNPAVTILIGMLSTAYMAHFNAPKFYTELKDNTIPRYLRVVASGFAISIALFCAIASAGFLTFGSACSGLILNNYSTKDALMGISRLAVAVSIVFSYPLAFIGMRDGVLDLVQIKNKSTRFLNTLTVGLLSGITFLATIVPDVSFVLAFAG
jgi:amino acid permease